MDTRMPLANRLPRIATIALLLAACGTAGAGTLRVFEPSAQDGSPTKTTEYPVWLTP